jgi:alkaline phosphatase D
VRWEVAVDAAFGTLVAQGEARATAAADYTVKVDASGLRAGTRYHFRFRAYDVTSPVGRTRTLPEGAVAQVKLAVFSCSNYPTGYFNVYADAARRDDLDATVHLGDYIYEYGQGGVRPHPGRARWDGWSTRLAKRCRWRTTAAGMRSTGRTRTCRRCTPRRP